MLKKDKIKIVILAAGKGTRMKSDLPKALEKLKGKSMIKHLLESVLKSGIDKRPVIVVGYKKELVIKELGKNYDYITQREQLGTGHALATARGECADAEHIVVLYADQPFIRNQTIKNIIKKHLKSEAKITFTTTEVLDFSNSYKVFWTFARILRDKKKIAGIREYKDASEEEKNIKEVNSGCYIFNAEWLWKNLKKIKNKNAQKEYYLTDLIPIALKNKEKIESIKIDPREALGVNSKEELGILERFSVQ